MQNGINTHPCNTLFQHANCRMAEQKLTILWIQFLVF